MQTLLIGFGALTRSDSFASKSDADTTILCIALGLLAAMVYATWLRFSSWATQRNFVAAYIVLPFFLLLSVVFAALAGALVAMLSGGADGLMMPVFALLALLAIAAAVWKIRAVR